MEANLFLLSCLKNVFFEVLRLVFLILSATIFLGGRMAKGVHAHMVLRHVYVVICIPFWLVHLLVHCHQ